MTLNESYDNLHKYCINANGKIEFLKSKFGDNAERTYAYVAMFQKIGRYENLYNTEVLNFTKSKLMATFESTCSTAASFNEQYRMLKNYFAYCEKTILEISFEDLDLTEELNKKYVRDFYEFDGLLDKVFGTEFDDGINSMRRACLYLLFLGLKRDCVLNLLRDDIDDSRNSIFISMENRYVESYMTIPTRCMELFRKCKHMTTYITRNPMYGEDKSERMLRDTKYLIRGDANTYVTPACPRHFIEKIFQMKEFKALNRDLSTVSIYNSGLFSWLYEQENAGRFDDNSTNKSFGLVLKDYIGVEKKSAYLYRKDYKNWKRIYNL